MDGIQERVECVGQNRNGEQRAENCLDGLSDATREDKEQMNQMASTNEAMVELCQNLTEAKIQQGKQITDLIVQVEKLNKLLMEESTTPA